VNETIPGLPLANFLDALGHRVTAEVTPSGLLGIFARTADEGLNGGWPALNTENAVALRDGLNEYIARESQ